MLFSPSSRAAAWLQLLLALLLGIAHAAAQQPAFLEDERFESLRAELAEKEATFHEPRTPSEADLEELPVRSLGPHWSGLDRLKLFRELKANDLAAAAARIEEALQGVESDASVYTVLIELADTSAFSACEPALRELARRFAESERPGRPGARDDGERRRDYLRALAYERVAKDPEAAREAYAALLGREPLQWLKSPQERARGRGLSERFASAEERSAFKRLARLEGVPQAEVAAALRAR